MSEAGKNLVRRYADGKISIDELEDIISSYDLSEYSRDEVPALIQDHRSESPSLLDKAGNRWITSLSVIGALLVFAGLWLGLRHFISDVSDIALLGGTIGVNALFAIGGYAIWNKLSEYRKIGHGFIIVAVLMFGASLFVFNQVVDLEFALHWMILTWSAAAILTAYILKSRPSLIVGIFVLGLWMQKFFTSVVDVDGNVLAVTMLFYGAILTGLGSIHNRTGFSKFRNTYLFFGLWAALYTAFITLIFNYSIEGSRFTGAGLYTGFATFSGLTVGIAVLREKSMVDRLFQLFVYFVALISAGILYVGTDYFGDFYTMVYVFMNTLLLASIVLSVLSAYRRDSRPLIFVTLSLFVLFVLHIANQTIFELLPSSISVLTGGFILLGMAYYLQRNSNRIKDLAEKSS